MKKAVILAAGKGTRMMPMTNAIPKPMLPYRDRPMIDDIVEEAFLSGIEEVLIVTGYKENVLRDHVLQQKDPRITLLTQKEQFGTAHALLEAEAFVCGEDFALLLGDEVITGPPAVPELIQVFQSEKASMVTGIERAKKEDITSYNAVLLEDTSPPFSRILEMVEKPQKDIPSLITSIGRYVISSRVFMRIKEAQATKKGAEELQLTELFHDMAQRESVFGVWISGRRVDLGTKEKWLAAQQISGVESIEKRRIPARHTIKGKPNTLTNRSEACSFCDRKAFRTNHHILEERGEMIWFENKYPTSPDTLYQTVLIETARCGEDLSTYCRDDAIAVLTFALEIRERMKRKGEFSQVLLLKNHGADAGGSMKHAHMQIVGLKGVTYDEELFEAHAKGSPVFQNPHVEVALAETPYSEFYEFIVSWEKGDASYEWVSWIQTIIRYIGVWKEGNYTDQYNLAFHETPTGYLCKIIPRKVNSVYHVGYGLHFAPDDAEVVAEELRQFAGDKE